MTGVTTLALAGDTMLGRGVAEQLSRRPARSLFDEALLDLVGSTDGMLLNLECCLSTRGEPWPGRVFHFRGPPAAVEALQLLGVRCVTLANNHALDYGVDALLDTLETLRTAGIAVAGAGEDREAAQTPVTFALGALTVTLLAFSDHPEEYAAGRELPGIAYADLGGGLPEWVRTGLGALHAAPGPVLVSPHWGPNMTTAPVHHVRRAATELVGSGVSLVAGHSAHVFHGVAGPVLFDLGDFVDDYAIDPVLRNDLGLLWLVTLEDGVPSAVEAVPLHLDHCRTALAHGTDLQEVRRRFREACTALGTDVTPGDRLVVRLPAAEQLS